MKKVFALILACCLLLTGAAFAEENVAADEEMAVEEMMLPAKDAFMMGLEELLDSTDLTRDELNLNLTVSGDEVFSGTLRGLVTEASALVDILLNAEDTALEAQITDEEIYASVAGSVFNLKFEDVEDILTAVSGQLMGAAGIALNPQELPQIDTEALTEIGQLFLQTVIMPHLTFAGSAEGTKISFAASGSELLADVSAFVDAVLAEEKYTAVLDTLLSTVASMTQQELPTMEQLAAMWPDAKAQLAQTETDFSLNLELMMDAMANNVDLTAAMGVPEDMFSMTWTFRRGENSLTLNGKLAETRTYTVDGGEETREYPINVDFACVGDDDGRNWNFSVDYPSQAFSLTLEGNRSGMAGEVFMNLQNMYVREANMTAQLNYSVSDDSLMAVLNITPRMSAPYVASLLISEKNFSLKVTNYRGQKVFALSAMCDDYGTLVRAAFEMNNGYEAYALRYDGEKIVFTTNDVTVTCTGEFESDHAYVVTLHAEGEYVTEDQSDAWIRVEYEGEPGDYAITGRVIDPTGEDAGVLALTCSPSSGDIALLSEAENILYLTPETVAELVSQLLAQYSFEY